MNIDPDIVELVVKRLEAMPPNLQVHLGNYGTYEKKDLIHQVKEQTPLGKKIISIQIAYLKSLKEGF